MHDAGKAKATEIGTNKPIPEEVKYEVCPNEECPEAKSISSAPRSATPNSTSIRLLQPDI